MKERDAKIKALRNETIGTLTENISWEELFQNNTLRPILKFQNDLLIELFITYATKNKNVFFNLSLEKRISYIENVSISDVVFRNQLIGVVIGLFSIGEYIEYSKNPSNFNKRIITMLIERWKSQSQLLEKK